MQKSFIYHTHIYIERDLNSKYKSNSYALKHAKNNTNSKPKCSTMNEML